MKIVVFTRAMAIDSNVEMGVLLFRLLTLMEQKSVPKDFKIGINQRRTKLIISKGIGLLVSCLIFIGGNDRSGQESNNIEHMSNIAMFGLW